MIAEEIRMTDVNYIANAGVAGKKGFQAYKRYMGRLRGDFHRENNNVREMTVWEKAKTFRSKK